MSGRACIVFSFPEPESDVEMMTLVANARELFDDKPELKVHLAVRSAADEVVDVLVPNDNDSNLIHHARVELEKIGEEPDVISWYIRVIRAFVSFGHSGGSAEATIPVLNELLRFKNLSPLTDDPREWIRHDEDVAGIEGGVWQNARNGEAFSPDGGKHYYLLSEGANFTKPEPLHETVPHGVQSDERKSDG